MFFDKSYINNLKQRISVSDVVARTVRLKSKGKGEFTGLCPFHQEKTPSFHVSDNKGFYHCFGCGAHGDAVKFIMEQKGLSYPEAIKELALEAGIALPKYTEEDKVKQKKIDNSYEVLELATQWFENNLHVSNSIEARNYLKNRGLTDATIRRFRLGFAPDSRDALRVFLVNKGVDESIIIENGLVGVSEDGNKYDRFRGRVMFPIFDAQGKVIAFGGRILDNTKEVAKYLNSPETELFKKSYTLYAYNFARDIAYKKEEVIIVEGYMDVIAMHQAGFVNCVAPLGTAVTEFHLQHLWKICKEPTFCLDGDSAGIRASKKTAENFITKLEPGYSMKFAFLKDGKDPDEVIKNYGVAAMQANLDNATSLADFIWQQNLKEKNPQTPERKAEFADEMLNLVKSIENQLVMQFYRNDFQQRIGQILYGKKKSNILNFPDVKREGKLDGNQHVIEKIKEKLIFLSARYPWLLFEGQNEEILINLQPANKLLEKLADVIIDFRLHSSMEGTNFEGLILYLRDKKMDDLTVYLKTCALKEEFKNLDGEREVSSAWGYLVSEFYLSSAQDEFNNNYAGLQNDQSQGGEPQGDKSQSDEEKFLQLQNNLRRLKQERDHKLKIFEMQTSND